MNIEQKIENGQGIFYHELGHLISYLLANENTVTELGEVEKFDIGFELNCVSPANQIYHIELTKSGIEELKLNTQKIERTIAWFIEVIAGCTFQCCFQGVDFKYCFGHEQEKIGSVDFANLSVVRPISSFNWTFDQIFEMQKDLKKFIVKHYLIHKIKPIVEDLKLEVKNSQNSQISLHGKELKQLNLRLKKTLNDKIVRDYMDIILIYKDIMTEKASR